MKERVIDFSFKARYYTLGDVRTSTQVWIVLHGYGQLAQFFISKFKSLTDKGVAVIAPEGLSRFYLEEVTSRTRTGNNRVGATWMTRENRQMDIDNYLTYLNTIFEEELGGESKNLTLLGFSQGAATASRWLISSNIRFQRLILWAGILPPDMDFEAAQQKLTSTKVITVLGKRDPFLTSEKMEEMTAIKSRLGIIPQEIYFDGGHEINTNVLHTLA